MLLILDIYSYLDLYKGNNKKNKKVSKINPLIVVNVNHINSEILEFDPLK